MLAVHTLGEKVEHYHTHKYLDMQKIKGITAEIKEKNRENCDFFGLLTFLSPFIRFLLRLFISKPLSCVIMMPLLLESAFTEALRLLEYYPNYSIFKDIRCSLKNIIC